MAPFYESRCSRHDGENIAFGPAHTCKCSFTCDFSIKIYGRLGTGDGEGDVNPTRVDCRINCRIVASVKPRIRRSIANVKFDNLSGCRPFKEQTESGG